MAASQCPPGVICIGAFSLVVLLAATVVAMYLATRGTGDTSTPIANEEVEEVVVQTAPTYPGGGYPGGGYPGGGYPGGGYPGGGYPGGGYPGGPPLSVMMRGRPRGAWEQVGFLSHGTGGAILPLMGRELHAGRDTWQYYAVSEQRSAVRLPVSSQGRACTGEHGCSSLVNGDSVYVEGYNQLFTATLYERTGPHYLPYV